MRIDRLKVEGFGHFRKFELELKPGLNVLYGPNEAGKSTLLAFVRAILFGFEGRKEPERYEDEGSGPFGGELWLTTPQGPLTVRRTGRKRVEGELLVKDGQGELVGDGRLREALFHINKALFREMFAFSLAELSSIGALVEQKDVSAALFAAGTQGAHRLPEALKLLRASTDELYRPGGKMQQLNRAITQLLEVRAQLDAVGDRPDAYFSTRERLLALDGEEQQLTSEIDALTSTRDRCRRLLQVVDDVRMLKVARGELLTLPDLAAFPEGALARLETLSQGVEQARTQRGAREEALARCERAFKLASDDKLGEESEQRLRGAADAFNARCAQYQALPGRRESLNARRRQIEEDLKNLGLKLTADGLLSADFSTAARASISGIKDRIADADRTLAQLDERHRAAKAKTAQVEQEVLRRTGEADKLSRSIPATVRRALAALSRVGELQQQLTSLHGSLADKKAQRESVAAQQDPAPINAVPGWTVPLSALVLGAVSAMAYVGAGLKILVFALLGSSAVFSLLALVQRRARQMHERALVAHGTREKQRSADLARLSAEQGALEGRVAAVERELSEAAVDADVAANAPGSARDARSEQLAEELRAVERRIELSRELEALMPQLTAVRREEQTAHADRSVAEASRSRLLRDLSQLCAPRGFPAELNADHALYLFAEAANLKTRLLEVGAAELGLVADERSCAQVVTALVTAADEFELPNESPEAAAAAAVDLVDRAREGRRDRARLTSEREELVAQVSSAKQAEIEAKGALARLLELAGCEDGEALRARDARALRFRELSKEVRERVLQIESAAAMAVSAVEAELSHAEGQSALPAALLSAEQELQSRAQRLRLLEQERGEKRSALKAWEQDETVSRLRSEEELYVARVSELVQRYSVERTALALLERSRARFEKEAQPRVVQLASTMFAGLTGGRYLRAFLPTERPGELWVNAADGQERAAAQLSRGTREQLYLAFRLAVIEEFAQTRGPLPIIVDDILVNFDEQRTKNTLKVFARLSSGHQFIAFTHNMALRDAFAEHGANVIEVSRPRTQLFDVVKAS